MAFGLVGFKGVPVRNDQVGNWVVCWTKLGMLLCTIYALVDRLSYCAPLLGIRFIYMDMRGVNWKGAVGHEKVVLESPSVQGARFIKIQDAMTG
jgi:hypothetical protein